MNIVTNFFLYTVLETFLITVLKRNDQNEILYIKNHIK